MAAIETNLPNILIEPAGKQFGPLTLLDDNYQKRTICFLADFAKCQCDCRCGTLEPGLTCRALVHQASVCCFNYYYTITNAIFQTLLNRSFDEYTFPTSNFTTAAFNGRILPRWWLLNETQMTEMERADRWLCMPFVPEQNPKSICENPCKEFDDNEKRLFRARHFIVSTMEMVKQLSSFRDINAEDQNTLFKAGCISVWL